MKLEKRHIVLLVFSLVAYVSLAQNKNPVVSFEYGQVEELKHNWHFAYNQLFTVPILDSSVTIAVNLPHTWQNTFIQNNRCERTGYATYYKRVILDKSYDNLGIYLKTASLNYKIFINGELIGEVGQVGTSKDESIPSYQSSLFPIHQTADTLDIIVQVSNYHYRVGGLWRAPVIGQQSAILKNQSDFMYLQLFLIGAISVLVLYFIALSFPDFRRKDINYFIALCLVTVVRILSSNDYLIVDLFPNLSWFVYIRLEFISYFIVVVLVIKLLIQLLDFKGFYKSVVEFIAYIFILLSIFTLLLSTYISSFFIIISYMIAAVLFLFGAGGMLHKIFSQKSKEAIILLIGSMLLGLSILLRAFSIFDLARLDFMAAIGLFSFFFSSALVISIRQGSAFEKMLQLKSDLLKVNTELEEEIVRQEEDLKGQKKSLALKNYSLSIKHEQKDDLIKEKDSLIALVAQDLRSPLIRNYGLIDIFKREGEVSNEVGNYLEMIHSSTESGLKLIKDLAHLYSVEAATTPENTRFDLHDFGVKIIRNYEKIMQAKQIKLLHQLPPKGTFVNTDQDLLMRIMDNIISNAVKFSARDTSISITLSTDSKQLVFSCKDQGPGINKTEQAQLFKKFQKLSNLPTGGEHSTGLGLSIVKQIVDQLNGKITVESKMAKGSLFKVSIPIA